MGTIYLGALGATGRQARARSLAEHAASNTTEETNDRCQTPDDSTAEDEHSDHNRTNFDPRQAPARAPFAFRGLSCQLRRTAHVRFVKARPARPISDPVGCVNRHQAVQSSRRRKRTRDRADTSRGKIGGNHGARYEMRRARGQPGPRRVDDGDRDVGVHEGEPE